MFLQLRDMTADRPPTLDLALVIGTTPPEIVTAIPLKPAARVLRVNPAFPAPDRERLRRIDAEEIELWSVPLGTEPGVGKPVVREFRLTVCHVFAAKNPEPKHLFRGQLRFETRGKILSGGFRQEILITALHPVVDLDPPWF